jgi:hypothetical protein
MRVTPHVPRTPDIRHNLAHRLKSEPRLATPTLAALVAMGFQ